MNRLFLTLSIFTLIRLEGTIIHSMDHTYALKCVLSSRHHNRICVENGRIQKVIFPEERLLVRVENISGQIFVQPKGPFFDTTLLSVITDDGSIQDIEISFEEKDAEVVILQDFKQGKNEFMPTEICPKPLIDTILQGHVPAEYTPSPTCHTSLKLKPGINIAFLQKLVGKSDTIYVFSIKNAARSKQTLYEYELAMQHSEWIFLEKNFLAPREQILAIVAVGHE